jgi:exonuclease VII large subunit
MKLSLLLTIIGTSMLFLYVEFVVSPIEAEIKEIDSSFVGKEVIVAGNIESYTEKNGNYFIVLEDKEKINAVMFEKQSGNSIIHELKKGDRVMANGEINNYKGGLEIIIKSIKIIE